MSLLFRLAMQLCVSTQNCADKRCFALRYQLNLLVETVSKCVIGQLNALLVTHIDWLILPAFSMRFQNNWTVTDAKLGVYQAHIDHLQSFQCHYQ